MTFAQITQEQINCFKNLFKGREDCFAVRWEKGGRSGFMPAYRFDPHQFRLHKIHGGTLATFPDKQLLRLTDDEILSHLVGRQFIGLYPLLPDNTSCFMVADFDNEHWQDECLAFIQTCKTNGLHAYLERSQSGRGGHVWIFFEDKIPASSSRALVFNLLKQAGLDSIFDRNKSFDRLFPNQDYLTGKGFGNLIALPLNPLYVARGNCCFVDDSLNPYPDQWAFLESVRKIPTAKVECLLHELNLISRKPEKQPGQEEPIFISLSNTINIPRHSVPPLLAKFINENLVFANSAWYVMKQTGKSTYKTKKIFKLFEEIDDEIIIPRGFMGKLILYLKENNLKFLFEDLRPEYQPLKFNSKFTLLPHQENILKQIEKKDFGVIVAPPGSGKTIIGLKIIELKKVRALIVVHRKQLMDQWIDRIQAFLGIPRNTIGRIGQGKTKVGELITVAMIQSLKKYCRAQDSENQITDFGIILIDECHHIPAESYREAIRSFVPRYQYGLTATPYRKGSEQRAIFIHLGEIIARILPQEIEGHRPARLNVRETSLDIPFDPKTDTFETLSKVIVHDSARNTLIAKDIHQELKNNRRVIVITERKEHIDALNHLLKQSVETITLSGDDPKSKQQNKIQQLQSGNFQVLITTGQLLGEGFDIQGISALFLVYPFSFKGKLIQYIGRVQRSEKPPVIYDYHDRKVGFLNRLFLKRNAHYRHFDRQATLFDDVETQEIKDSGSFVITQRISVLLNDLAFNYGHISFEHEIEAINMKIRFEIENENIRPEFTVLKPYFIKVLKTKFVVIEIFAEAESGKVIAQSAVSSDLDRINREIIDGVRFRINQKLLPWIKSGYDNQKQLMDFEQLKSQQPEVGIYESAEDLLNSTLMHHQYRHSPNLRYLSSQHASEIIKIRFVLQPFAFVFLLKGINHFHVVLETLDTEEATYIWMISNDKSQLPGNLEQINKDLQLIRNEGRQAFLTYPPENFSRITHLYLDPQKGFIIWKDLLEQQLV